MRTLHIAVATFVSSTLLMVGCQRTETPPPPSTDSPTKAVPAVTVSAAQVPALVDELPLLALAACHARGDTVVRGASELRVKETDRIEAVAEELRRVGAHIRATRDGFRIRGVPARLRGGNFDARGDHRLAMLGAVVGLSSREGVELHGAEAVEASFPGFFDVLGQLTGVTWGSG